MNYSPLSQGASIILQAGVVKPLSPETRTLPRAIDAGDRSFSTSPPNRCQKLARETFVLPLAVCRRKSFHDCRIHYLEYTWLLHLGFHEDTCIWEYID
ncbi:MAG: hypothetical protein ACXAEU_02810 [Candidatus Hodarchaeales archaeon]